MNEDCGTYNSREFDYDVEPTGSCTKKPKPLICRCPMFLFILSKRGYDLVAVPLVYPCVLHEKPWVPHEYTLISSYVPMGDVLCCDVLCCAVL